MQSQETLKELAKLVSNAFRSTNFGQQGDLMVYVANELKLHGGHNTYVATMLENIGRAHGTSPEFGYACDNTMRPDKD